jgi:hypothetical protein
VQMCTGSAPFTPLPPLPPPPPHGEILPTCLFLPLPFLTVVLHMTQCAVLTLSIPSCLFFRYSFYFPFSSFFLPLFLLLFPFYCTFSRDFLVLSSVFLPSPFPTLIVFFSFSSAPSLSLHLLIFFLSFSFTFLSFFN